MKFIVRKLSKNRIFTLAILRLSEYFMKKGYISSLQYAKIRSLVESVYVESNYYHNQRVLKKHITELSNRKSEMLKFKYQPLVSILMPVYNTNISYLKEAIKSVALQEYENWELIIVDDASPHKSIDPLIKKIAKKDKRIKIFRNEYNAGISQTTQIAFENATGDYIGHMDHDDILRSDAIFRFIEKMQSESKPDYMYSDEVVFYTPAFSRFYSNNNFRKYGKDVLFQYKPDFNLAKLISHNYICHFFMLSKELIKIAGGYKEGYDGSQDHELSLRTFRFAKNVQHISYPVYYWRMHRTNFSNNNNEICIESSKKAISEFLTNAESGDFKIDKGRLPFSYHVKRKIKSGSLVSIIIPFKDKIKYVYNLVTSIMEYTKDVEFEILLIDNLSEEVGTKAALDYLCDSYENVQVYKYEKMFNFAAINNFGARFANGNYLLLLNNDTLVFRKDWLYELLQHASRPNVGAVGPMLLFKNKTIQHAGVVLGLGGVAGHIGIGLGYNYDVWSGRLMLEHNVSCLTGAALMVPTEVWNKVGGMDESFPVAYNDVDFCITLKKYNFDLVYNPYSILFHFESISRGDDMDIENMARFRADIRKLFSKWGKDVVLNDPFYSKNLSVLNEKMHFKKENEDEILISVIENHLHPFKDLIGY